MAVVISTVSKNSRADRAGILPKEKLLSINGNEIVDVLDYRFYQTSRDVLLEIENACGIVRNVKIHKGEYEEIGLEFETILWTSSIPAETSAYFVLLTKCQRE